ncbi:MAG: hypothetical protein GY749_22680 [Desulfobacteraceae bacterium]|nr:hypothetical protein [Desulfobacteraceae bacterium]
MSPKITNELSNAVESDLQEIERTILKLGNDLSALNSKLSNVGVLSVGDDENVNFGFRNYTAGARMFAPILPSFSELATHVAQWHEFIEKFDSRDKKMRIGGGGK